MGADNRSHGRRYFKSAVVRDFRAGEWLNYVATRTERWDSRAKELVRKLVAQKRLIDSEPALTHSPSSDVEWCHEALASHRSKPLTGIIASAETATHFNDECVVGSIARLEASAWWQTRRESLLLERNTSEYLKHLGLILKHANLLMFIDPHLDPTKRQYAEFVNLLLAAKRHDICPARIEIHRVCYEGFERAKGDEKMWRTAFEILHQPMVNAGLTATVFIWDDFHDRYFITDLIGVLMGNGFDISGNPNAQTGWARISREDREKIQRKFDDPNNDGSQQLHCKFVIGERI